MVLKCKKCGGKAYPMYIRKEEKLTNVNNLHYCPKCDAIFCYELKEVMKNEK